MSGHSKWHNIKRKKEANDAKRSKEFSKLTRLITVAAREGGGDVETNPSLRLAVEKAKQGNMPKDIIQKAIQKGTGNLPGTNYEEAVYEGYGPGGVAFLVTALTDNNNRTVSEIKMIFNKNNGSLGAPGSTSYIFDSTTKEPSFLVPCDESLKEKVTKLAEALDDNDDVQDVYFNVEL